MLDGVVQFVHRGVEFDVGFQRWTTDVLLESGFHGISVFQQGLLQLLELGKAEFVAAGGAGFKVGALARYGIGGPGGCLMGGDGRVHGVAP